MNRTHQSIALFFFTCLFNVAFIPQLCLNSIQDLESVEVECGLLYEESNNGLNISEEGNKLASGETNEDNGFDSSIEILANSDLSSQLCYRAETEQSFSETKRYRSVSLIKTSPPPQIIS